jgi:LacI family transcriptional regulator
MNILMKIDHAESGPQVTQRDIARKLGISNAAVSLAHRDSLEIGLERRREIQALAEKRVYRSNPAAVSLSYQKQLTKHSAINASVAWLNLWPEQEDRGGEKCRFFDEYRRGAELCAAKFGYRIEDFFA